MVKNLLIKGNIKMGPSVYLFNLPAKNTCMPTQWCLEGKNGKPACYALRNNFLFPNVIAGAKERFRLSRQDDFVERMVGEIHKKSPRYFRLHASGDFYGRKYADKIHQIAEACPNTLFRTTTRRRDLTDQIAKLNSLPNFVIRESLDHERQTPEMGLPFAALSSLPVVGEQDSYSCVDDCPTCEYHCWESDCNVDFEEH